MLSGAESSIKLYRFEFCVDGVTALGSTLVITWNYQMHEQENIDIFLYFYDSYTFI